MWARFGKLWSRIGREAVIAGAVIAAIVFLVAASLVSAREAAEGEHFAGTCVDAPEPAPIPADAFVPTASDLVQEPDTLPAPQRARGGERPVERAENRLAKLYEPILTVAKADRFWPVSVPTLYDLYFAGGFTRFLSPGRSSDHARPGDLRPGRFSRQFLDYPAEIDHVQDQFCSVGKALGIERERLALWQSSPDRLEPNRSAQFYLLDLTSPNGRRRELQYWFFYPLNYLPTVTDDLRILTDPIAAIRANADFHEGDFEHVTVHLHQTQRGFRPAGLTMARHDGEDKWFAWNSPTLQREGPHPIVHASLGGHASYDDCGLQLRPVGLIDWTLCGEERVFSFGADTPLVDLETVPWACWGGHFGQPKPASPIPMLFVSGPSGPLFQTGNERGLASLCAEDRG